MLVNSETSIRIKQGKIDSETFCQKFGFHHSFSHYAKSQTIFAPIKNISSYQRFCVFLCIIHFSEIICWFTVELRQCMWNNAHTQHTLVKMGVRGCWLVGCEVLARFQSSVKYFQVGRHFISDRRTEDPSPTPPQGRGDRSLPLYFWQKDKRT